MQLQGRKGKQQRPFAATWSIRAAAKAIKCSYRVGKGSNKGIKCSYMAGKGSNKGLECSYIQGQKGRSNSLECSYMVKGGSKGQKCS